MPDTREGILVQILAQHDFNQCVAMRVFVGPAAIRERHAWIKTQEEYWMDKARKIDPTFDAYSFGVSEEAVEVEG